MRCSAPGRVRPRRSVAARASVLAAATVACASLLVVVSVASAAPGSDPASHASPATDAASFARDLQAALPAGAVAVDRLWVPGAREEARRMMDIRTSAMFLWSDVRVAALSQHALGASPNGAPRAALETLVTGTATWRGAAWGVAQSFWTLQTDERREANQVVRREQWALEGGDGHWRARDRRPLGDLEIVEAHFTVDAYPGQDALLVEGSYYVRALADSVQFERFLLDRRAAAYDFRVNGALVPVVRGNELGSLGLGGFSPELESSFAFPSPLAKGEETLITFRLRSPLVHMSEPGFVTTVPLIDGAFRERLWIPIFRPSRADGPEETRIELTLRWPSGTFDRVGVAAPPPLDGTIRRGEEESSLTAGWTGDLHDLDFALLAPGVSLPVTVATWAPGVSSASVALLTRVDPKPEGLLAIGRRERESVLVPLLATSFASRDLSTELQELLPLDDDLVDELFDDSATDAERGADDRSAN